MNFNIQFKELFNDNPYPWQQRLFKDFLNDNIPDIIDIPTGLGKTSVMVIWFLSYMKLFESNQQSKLPTRLVYIVDRRSVVDQASDEIKKIYDWIYNNNDPKINQFSNKLHITKLRGGGGSADNKEWLKNPHNPSIIIGTVDMIGSRLLFSGYGVGHKTRPFYASLLGQDSLIILDETHLSPAMEQLLLQIQQLSNKPNEIIKPPKILLMSATQRVQNDNNISSLMLPNKDKMNIFSLNDIDLKNTEIKKRYNSTKKLKIIKTDKDEFLDEIVNTAQTLSGRIIIYLQKPADVIKIIEKLQSLGKDVITLTGTIRGFERDQLSNNDTYQSFLNNNNNDKNNKTCYLISTSAGEVGTDFNADNMICDLSTMDSMIQRLGRLNRNGDYNSNIIVIYHDKNDDKLSDQKQSTLEILKELENKNLNLNPSNFSKVLNNDNINQTFSPIPNIQPLTKDILDTWSMTSIKQYHSRPRVDVYLHGKDDITIPDTYIAWRDDVQYLINQTEQDIEDVLNVHRVLPHEILRDYTNEVYSFLNKLDTKQKIIIISPDNNYTVKQISDINKEELIFATILLPSNIGGLDNTGLLSSKNKNYVTDIADHKDYYKRIRLLIKVQDDQQYVIQEIGNNNTLNIKLDDYLKDKSLRLVYELDDIKINNNIYDDEDENSNDIYYKLQYYTNKIENQYIFTKDESLQDHLHNTEQKAIEITNKLNLPDNIKQAIILSAKYHDIGKDTDIWQDCMHVNPNDRPLAKTIYKRKPLSMGGFRHEFASLVKSLNTEINNHPEKDLILHLISSHHGWSRPHFNKNVTNYNKLKESKEQLTNTMIRYNKLQKRFGGYGLSYLESILRSADWIVS